MSLDAGTGLTIRAEMTATERCAMLRFHFPKGGVARVLVEMSRPGIAGFAAVDTETHEMTDYNPDRMDAALGPDRLPDFKGYFVVQFRHVPMQAKTYGMEGSRASWRGAYAEFRSGETVEARVGTSFISVAQARRNLQREMPAWNFDEIRRQLRGLWNEKLNRL